jgi:hypothetical protein
MFDEGFIPEWREKSASSSLKVPQSRFQCKSYDDRPVLQEHNADGRRRLASVIAAPEGRNHLFNPTAP